MRSAALALAMSLAFVLAVQAFTQAKPDFSGTWRLDLARSDSSAHADHPGPVTVTITQSPADIRIETTTSKGNTSLTYKLSAAEPLSTTNPLARWRDDALVTDAIRDVGGQSVTVQQTRRLSADGKEMIVESVVNVQHGYTLTGAQTYSASRDTFVKVIK
jgi:hypothetical protein